MSMKFGLGIENEMQFNYMDAKRKNRGYSTDYGHDLRNTRWWKPNSGWTSTESNAWYYRYNDGTVDGGGFEIQTTRPMSINKKPKEVIMNLFESLNDGAKKVKSSNSNLKFVIPNPFGIGPGFTGGSPGSFHVNLTMPYEETTIGQAEVLRAYNEKLFRGIKVVRAIQPLMQAMIGGTDLSSVGNPSRAEGSSRTLYDSYGNMGNVALNSVFKDALFGRNGRSFKWDNSSPSYRRIIRTTTGSNSSRDTSVGDIVVKNYTNVASGVKTIEFRFMDPYFVPNLYEMIKVLIAALEHGSNVDDIIDSRTSPVWNEAAAKLMTEGWNTRVPANYIRFLNSKLGLRLQVKEGKRADLVFEDLAKKLWNKNKTGIWVRTMFDDMSEPKVLVLNRYNWEAQFRHKYINDNEFKTYVDKVLTILHKIDASQSSNWINVNTPDKNKVAVRDIILDDPRFGLDMGIEDFEDMLFLFERAKIVEMKVNENGHIEKVKMIGTPSQSMKKIDNLKTIEGIEETYFGERVEEVVEEITETAPTPAQARTVQTTTTDEPNIDMNLLNISVVSIVEDSELDYNVSELQDVFNEANFVSAQGRPFVVSVYAANITYDGRRLNAFWIANGVAIKLYLDARTFDVDDRLSAIVDRLSRGLYSPRSVRATNNFMPDLTNQEFFSRLRNVAQQQFDKASKAKPQKIELNAAGVERLKKYGIRVVSISRGRQYFLANKKKYVNIKKSYGDSARLVKYIPYQKNIYVKKEGPTFKLMTKGKVLDTVVGGQNE